MFESHTAIKEVQRDNSLVVVQLDMATSPKANTAV
jgi:hypothetical protein